MKNYISFLAIAMAAVCSCTNFSDDTPRGIPSSAGVSFKTQSASLKTKASADEPVFELIETVDLGGEVMEVYVAETTESEVITKGATRTTKTIEDSGEKFILNAFLETVNESVDKSNHYLVDEPYSYSAEKLLWVGGDDCTWRNSVNTHFWACMPESIKSDFTWGTDYTKTALHYTMPAPVDGSAAESTEDVIVAYAKGKYTAGDSAIPVDINFRHALAQITFDLSEVNVMDSKATYGLTSVTLKVQSQADCDINLKDGAVSFDWKNLTSEQDYKQNVKDVDYDATSKVQSTESVAKYHIIPQTGVKLSLEYKKSDETVKKPENSIILPNKFEAEKTYTIKIKIKADDKVSITVTDTVTGTGVAGNTKTGVNITNTGNVKTYVRAAIVANWVDASNNIVANWVMNESDFEGLSVWTKKSDGFYYYPELVDAKAAVTLFTKYTVPAVPAGADHLEMTIAAQNIRKQEQESGMLWGSI